MHMAHQELFKKLDKNGGILVIQNSYANLSPFRHRQKHTKYPLYFYPLENIKHLTGEQFIKLVNEEFPKLEKIVVGYDFHFGHLAANDNVDLKKLFTGDVEIIKEYKVDEIAVHSRVIREYLRDGNMEVANKLLGYNYNMTGFVIKGQGLGKKQFVPTINIDVTDFLIPQEGIYITKTILNKKSYESVSFIGHRTTTDGKFAVETHILDKEFHQTVPKNIEIEFIKKIRDNQKYENFEDLKKQIEDDIKNASSWFREKK
jgi:riboflavin kinase/FMN adenylyltransferase